MSTKEEKTQKSRWPALLVLLFMGAISGYIFLAAYQAYGDTIHAFEELPTYVVQVLFSGLFHWVVWAMTLFVALVAYVVPGHRIMMRIVEVYLVILSVFFIAGLYCIFRSIQIAKGA
jgi:hypothetical protein